MTGMYGRFFCVNNFDLTHSEPLLLFRLNISENIIVLFKNGGFVFNDIIGIFSGNIDFCHSFIFLLVLAFLRMGLIVVSVPSLSWIS